MPVSVKDLANNERTVPVTFDGEVVNVTYRPGLITRDFLKEIDLDDLDGIIKSLNALVVTWDVMDGDEVYAPTIDNLTKLGRRFLVAMLAGITYDLKPGKVKSAT